jgi:hypothetical protein
MPMTRRQLGYAFCARRKTGSWCSALFEFGAKHAADAFRSHCPQSGWIDIPTPCKPKLKQSLIDSMSKPMVHRLPHNLCRVAIYKNSLWAVRSMQNQRSCWSRNPHGVLMWVLLLKLEAELLALRDAGCAVLVVSEELDELFEICDRLYVMANGKLSPSIDRKKASVAQIGEWMSGLWESHAEA